VPEGCAALNLPVTVTVIVLPTHLPDSFIVRPVAPLIAWPDACHWYLRVSRTVPQSPACAASVSPALTVPVIVGVAAVRVATET
jgi:hypothetical protein